MKSFSCSLAELDNALQLLKDDIINVPGFEDQIKIHLNVISESSIFKVKNKNVEGSRDAELNCKKILEALNSCCFYLNALRIERISFWNTLQYLCNQTVEELDETDTFTSEKFLKEYLQKFKELAWKQYAEIISFSTLLMTFYSTVSAQETEEVTNAFKISLENYQSAITLDLTQPDNAETLLCALSSVKSSTRSMQSYLWTIKILMTH